MTKLTVVRVSVSMLVISAMLSGCGNQRQKQQKPFNYVLGTQTIGANYQFTDQPVLIETSQRIFDMGSNIIKFSLDHPKGSQLSLTELVKQDQNYSRVFDMPFDFYFLWAYVSSPKINFKDGLSEEEKTALYDNFYDLSAYLLREYNKTGKSFYFGHWEGDWSLIDPPYSPKIDPTDTAVVGMIEWLNIKQKAVEDAQRDILHENVYIYTYTEVNMVQKAIKGGKTLTNNVLPHSNVDYVSFSCYDSLYPFHDASLSMDERETRMEKLLLEAMDYIESKLPPKNVPERRVFIGEYGFALEHVKQPQIQDEFARTVIKSALKWGCPFVLYWEMYCNTIDHPSSDYLGYGFWMIDKNGVKQPVYFTHENLLKQGREFVQSYRAGHKRNPSRSKYRRVLLDWLDKNEN
jgi:hypothetical protein